MTIASLVEAEASSTPTRQDRAGDLQPAREPQRRGHQRAAPDRRDGQLRARPPLGVALTPRSCSSDTPYNTYLRPGPPAAPIEAPGDEAIEAALNPTEGAWYFYVTVNLDTGETKFAETYDEFLSYKAELDEYCDDLRRLLT